MTDPKMYGIHMTILGGKEPGGWLVINNQIFAVPNEVVAEEQLRFSRRGAPATYLLEVREFTRVELPPGVKP